MKVKIKKITKSQFDECCNIANMLAKSLCPTDIVFKQFNNLSISDKNRIKKDFERYDEIRRRKIPIGEVEQAWFDCVVVDANIIATEFDVDPLTVMLCLHPPCKPNEKLVVI